MKKKQIIKLMKLPRTDAGNAERLRLLFKNTWKYLPQYKSWLHWDGHCWEGRKTGDLNWAVADAFQQLAMEIYRLPVPADDVAEQIYRLKHIVWLSKSQMDYHIRLAVQLFRVMCREETVNMTNKQ